MESDETEEFEDGEDADEAEETEERHNPEDILFEGEDIGYNAPDWLTDLLRERGELIDECERLGVDPYEVLPSCEDLHDGFQYVEFLGAEVDTAGYDGAAPGAGGWHRVVLLAKKDIPAAIRKGEEELQEGVRRMRLLYLRSKGFADLETDELEAIVGKLGPLDEAARGAEQREVDQLRETLEEAQRTIARLEKEAEEAADRAEEAGTEGASEDLRDNRETWRSLGLWPMGPLAWLSDGSVAYLHNFLDGCLSQHAFWHGVVEELRSAGIKVHAVDCRNGKVLAHSPASGIDYGHRVSLDESGSSWPTWNGAWRFALGDPKWTRLTLPPELGWLRDRLRDRLGVKATLAKKA